MGQAGDPGHLETMVRSRLDGMPLEQVLGWAQFGGLRVAVEPGVFVPRRRTEVLAELSLAVARDAGSQGRAAVVVELCCGSGAVSAFLLAALHDLELYASDVDPVAVRCARGNLGERAHVIRGDLYESLPSALAGRVDVVVSNAPHVPIGELGLMPAEARQYEPAMALISGDDGLDVLREVIAGAPARLAEGGSLLVETGAAQADETAALMEAVGLRSRIVRSEERAATVVIGQS